MQWMDPASSSLCELAADLVSTMDKQAIDEQIATALLTGIVAETNRFSNNKTTPATMSVSAVLMASGANQQLVMTKLEQAASSPAASPAAQETAPGEIQIRQNDSNPKPPEEHTVPIGGGAPTPPAPPSPPTPPAPVPEPPKPPEPSKPEEDSKPVASLEDLAGPDKAEEVKDPELARIHIDDQGGLHNVDEAAEQQKPATIDPTIHMGGSRMILQPPSMGDGSSGLVGDGPRDPFATPKAGGTPADLPSGAPTPPPVPPASPFSPPASANISAPPTPFMPPSMTPTAPAFPAPAAPPAPVSPGLGGPPADLLSGSPSGAPDPSHLDTARSAVEQAHGPVLPDLGAPALVGAAAPAPASNIPAPVGPPPPVPPPMLPPTPQ